MSEAARRRRVETRVVSILERERFEEIILPLIDYDEPYAAVATVAAQQTYRFVDRDGELVSIRSDFTPLVARALAPAVTAGETLRVFYRGDVIRYLPSRLGARREMFQVGAELVGDGSVEADAAILSLASAVLGALGMSPRIVYTDNSIPERIGPGAREALAGKRATGADNDLCARLVGGTATLDDLPDDIGSRLAKLATLVDSNCSAHIDDVDDAPGYYTGLRFRAYDGDSRLVVAQGGRYDTLYGSFGTATPAVGFTLTLDDLD
jgi:ATP phosphoribosyltransferase regulatory subunit